MPNQDEKHVQRNVGPRRIQEKPKNFGKSMKKLLSYDKKLTPFYVVAIVFAIASSICSIIGPNKLSDLTDEISKALVSNNIDMTTIKNISIFLLVLYSISAILSFLESFIMARTANKLAKKLRTQISHKINKLPLRYFDLHSFGDILSRVTNDVDTIGMSVSRNLGTFVSAVALLVASVVMMFYTNWIMALTAILTSIIGFVFMGIILGKSQKYFNARQVRLGSLNGHIEEMYSGYNVVKVYNGKNKSINTFKKLNQDLFDCSIRSEFLSGLMHPIMSFIGNLSYVSVCVMGAILVEKEIITFGVIVAFIMYTRLFTSPLQQIAQGLTNLQSAAASSERVFEFLEEKEMIDESEKKVVLEKDRVKGNIEFEHVKFGYDNGGKLVIKDFSCKAKAGQKIAIVGPTGAGKTTLVNLLMKFYEINSGDIKIDGVSTKDLTRENIHDLFIMVLQDTWLFNGTMRENIIYNKENISDEQVMDACKTVGLEHFIKSLPQGLDTPLADTDSISAGQKQLLTIARGMIESAPFLILDEATSNVDTRTEELVQNAMDKLTEGKTSFIIAHRLSTIKNADLILVMNEGNIIEQGSHEELLAQEGFYAGLYNSQFEEIEE